MQETEKDYICSLAKDSGMHTCRTLPNTKFEGRMCNDSATPGVAIGPEGFSINGSCINWNQYYTECRAGDKNPFQGAISFDHVGLAFIAVYQVGLFFLFINTGTGINRFQRFFLSIFNFAVGHNNVSLGGHFKLPYGRSFRVGRDILCCFDCGQLNFELSIFSSINYLFFLNADRFLFYA